MSSLPQSWHGVETSKPINPVSPLKRPKTLKLSSKTTVNGQISQLTFTSTQSERPTWHQRPAFDPSTIQTIASVNQTGLNGRKTAEIRVTQRPTKPTMPVLTKSRAKSMGNGQELKNRLNEESNMELLTLKKELSRVKDENAALKGKMRRAEEESAKKIKQFEKQLAVAKKDLIGGEKKRESTEEALAALKQKYQRLEVESRSKDLSMRKMQVSLRAPPRVTNDRIIPRNIPTNLLNSGASNARPLPSSASTPRVMNKTSPTSPETLRLKDTNKKLLQENTKLQQQLKDKDQEIKTLKVTLARNQRNSASSNSRVSSGHSSNKEQSSAVEKPRVSRSSLHRTSTKNVPNGKVVVQKVHKTTVVEQTITNGVQTKVKVPIIKRNGKTKDESIQDLQRRSAARKIQRSWRSHRAAKQGKAKQEKLTAEILLPEDHKELLEEDIEYLQSVLKGHLDRVEHEASFQTVEMTEEMASNIEALHQNCFESIHKDGTIN